MKIVLAGGGRVGGALAARLVAEGHAVTVIDRDREVCELIFEEVGAVTITGDATDARVLDEAGIANADVAAGLLARDADNLAFAMLVRGLSSARVMVRMLDASFREAYRLAAVRDVIAEAEIVVSRIVTEIQFPEVGGSLPLARGDAILFELPIAPRALVSGKNVAQIRGTPSFPRDVVFIGIVDPEGRIELPTGASVLRPGHVAILVARREDIGQAVACLTTEPARASEGLAGMVGALRRVDFLAPLSDEELAELARGIEIVRRAPGETVYRRGEPGESFFLVLAGEVSLSREGGEPVETVAPGGFFGEISLLTGEPRSSSATAVGECELVAIGRDDFRRVVMANPSVALEMSRLLGQRLAAAARARAPAAPRRGLFRR